MDTKILVGLDIHEYVKGLMKQFSHYGETPDMTERESKAYKAGINATLSLLDQAVNEILVNGEDGLIVHVPGLKTEEEFYSIEEIIERMNEV